MHFLIYDFEVFKKDWLVVFKSPTGQYDTIVNDYDLLAQYFNQHRNDVFVGFNNKHYDDFILKGILSNLDPYKISEWIIIKSKNGWQFPGLNKIYFNSLDLKQDIEGAIGISLKEIECNLGLSIEESTIDFEIDRKLTPDEIEQTIIYCKHDVDCTEKLMGVRLTYIKSRLQIIEQFNLPVRCLSMTNAQLTAEVMQAVKRDYPDGNVYNIPQCIQLKDQEILSFYTTPLDKSQNLQKVLHGVSHVIGFGGLHGAKEKCHFKGNIYNYDVASYYPSLIVKYKWMSRSVRDPEKFEQIYNQRLIWKKQKDPRQGAYKLILNTLSGAMDSDYNKLHDSLQCNQVRISGQLMLLDLLEKLGPYITLIQDNTDGIMFQTANKEVCDDIVNEWQKRTLMNMECDEIVEIYQKDVNNYACIDNKGQIKTKGGYVKNYSTKLKGDLLVEQFGDYRSNSMTIVDEAIVKHLFFNKSIDQIINNCNDPLRFQITTKKGPTFKRVEWQQKGQMIVVNNVNRVFASGNIDNGKVYKIKQNGNLNLIGGLPEHCLIYNQDLSTFDINLVDKSWYIEETKQRIKDFIGG